MSQIVSTVSWERGDEPFIDNRYSRAHCWAFDGGLTIPASSSPDIVPVPLSDAAAIDPEEAFVAAISSCHMLWFLAIAAKRGLVVDRYRDEASGEMGRNGAGKMAVTRVHLRPRATFSSAPRPTQDAIAAIHAEAHARCFIANSVNTEILCHPADDRPA
jgi:organic hydroperoxide reductase OsmC/OhrA